jgi:hypothetical protein
LRQIGQVGYQLPNQLPDSAARQQHGSWIRFATFKKFYSIFAFNTEGIYNFSQCSVQMFCNFYSTKNPKILNTSATTDASKKLSADLKSLEC